MTCKELSRYRAKQGLCTRCGQPNDRPGHSACSKCAERVMNRYYRRKGSGLCIDCGKPVYGATTRCKACNDRRNAWHRKVYHECLEKHICTKCQKYTAAPDRTKCEVCLAKEANRTRKKKNDSKAVSA